MRPIGEDPHALELISPCLSIWEAYATVHLVMPDGTVRLGGEAVAEVFRNLRRTRWFAPIFSIKIFGFRPFQKTLDLAYAILADIRPVFGCASCGTPAVWLRPISSAIQWVRAIFGKSLRPSPYFTPRSHLS